MRVYEIARELGVPASEVVEKLESKGISVRGHMSQVPENGLSFLRKTISSGAKNKSRQGLSSSREQAPENVGPIVLEPMSLDVLAAVLNKPASELIILLLGWGVPTTKNQMLSIEMIERIANHFEVELKKPVVGGVVQERPLDDFIATGKMRERSPVVAILGHVDHGKTTLLDFIRKSRVAAKERGGITQHLGAYEVTAPYEGEQKSIVFLDTPGHAAFAKMRQRGIAAADIAIILIAADDGVMPQTIEAIKAVRSIDMPIIVALNKADRVDQARIDQVKQSLAQHDLLIEEWGGEIICVPLSAKTGEGVDHLLDMILLRAQIMDLTASEEAQARGYVLESKIEKGRGAVATIILRHGSLSLGDYFVAGNIFGSVTSLIDSHGKRLKKASPSTPIQIAGFQELPQPGDIFKSISKEEYKKARPARRGTFRPAAVPRSFIEGACNIILKADSNLSLESLSDAVFRIGGRPENFNVVASGVGAVSESDVELAANTGAIIVGLHVKIDASTAALAKQLEVPLNLHDIIYRLLEDLEKEVTKRNVVEAKGVKIGQATVLRVFNIKKVGVIAGSQVDEGRFVSTGTVVVWRDDVQIGKGKIVSLQKERKTVKEVHEGSECGFVVEGFTSWKPGDRVECFIPENKEQ